MSLGGLTFSEGKRGREDLRKREVGSREGLGGEERENATVRM